MHAKPSPPSRGRILAVDDSADMRLLVQASLESFGFSVEAVESGLAALEAVRMQAFDAVILDVDMPGLDGMAVGRALRSDPKTCLSMIAMHTSVEESLVRKGFDGYDVYVPKPCSPRDLGHRVVEALRLRAEA